MKPCWSYWASKKCIKNKPALKTMRMFLFSECNCHEHADSCKFDERLYEASGQTSGGVCLVIYVIFTYNIEKSESI